MLLNALAFIVMIGVLVVIVACTRRSESIRVRSVSSGAAEAALAFLGVEPVLDLDLRLGEGTGAVLALSVVQAAALTLREMATFDGAGVSREKD